MKQTGLLSFMHKTTHDNMGTGPIPKIGCSAPVPHVSQRHRFLLCEHAPYVFQRHVSLFCAHVPHVFYTDLCSALPSQTYPRGTYLCSARTSHMCPCTTMTWLTCYSLELQHSLESGGVWECFSCTLICITTRCST